MPHLSALAREYNDKVTIVGIDIYEKKTTSMEKVKAFVDSMGHKMDYNVAVEDINFMETGWIDASGEKDNGIPRTFVVNGEGKLAWIGHPKELDKVLPQIVNNSWDINIALAKRNFNHYLTNLDDSLYYEVVPYFEDNRYEPIRPGKPDSVLSIINRMIDREPALKYAPRTANNIFSSLLKLNSFEEACKYGKIAMITPTYDEPPYGFIIGNIEWYSDKLNLPIEIYQLCAEAYQAKIDQIPYPELVNMPRLYNKMAAWYWHVCNKSKAIDAQQKAIEVLKSRKDFSVTEMAALESRLQEYKKLN
jgi:hypothetical protein